MARKTTEQFKNEVFKLVGNGYSVLGEYVNNKTHILMRHNECGTEWPVMPNNFLRGTKCPFCTGKIKKTTEAFKQEVFELVGNDYSVLGEYVNNKTHILMRHNECGTEWPVAPNSFLTGNRCPECNGGSRKTTIQYKKRVFNLVGNDYSVLGEYVNSKTHILMRHNECGTEWPVQPNSFLGGSRCPKCGRNQHDTEWFKEQVFNAVGNEYEVIGEYTRMLDHILMKHKDCETVYPVTPNDFIKGCRCPKCSTKKKSTEQFKQEVFELVGNEYEVLGNYEGVYEHILMKHVDCGTVYPVTPNGFIRGHRCPLCQGTMKKTTEQFKQEVFELEGNNYTVLGEYINANTHVLMRHNECGFDYPVRPSIFLRGSRCPQCNESKGEKAVRLYLEYINLSYEGQYPFLDLFTSKRKNPKFDFYISQKHMCIEFDGIQHIIPVKYYGGEIGFIKRHKRDKIKNRYCEENRIPLLRIRYDQIEFIPEMIDDLLENPDFYLIQHNTYLNNEEYYIIEN